MWRAFTSALRRDLLIGLRRRGDWLNPLAFFIMVITLFPLGIGPEPNQLQDIAPGILWVAALLATMLALDTLFRSDFENGTLEHLLLSPQPLTLLLLAKVLGHWMLTGVPLLLVSPLLALVLQLQTRAIPALLGSLLLGTLTLSLIGAIGAALTVALHRGGVLLALLVLPLFVPVLIFGSSCVVAAASGITYAGQLLLLAALCVLALVLAPLAIAAALRISVS